MMPPAALSHAHMPPTVIDRAVYTGALSQFLHTVEPHVLCVKLKLLAQPAPFIMPIEGTSEAEHFIKIAGSSGLPPPKAYWQSQQACAHAYTPHQSNDSQPWLSSGFGKSFCGMQSAGLVLPSGQRAMLSEPAGWRVRGCEDA